MKDNKSIDTMANAPVRKAIFKMSLPVIAGMMVAVLYNLVDTFFIGLLNDELQLAAVNIATPVFMIMMGITSIVSTGGASYISRCLGRGDKDQADRTLSTGLVIVISLSLIITIFGLVYLKPLMRIFGASESVLPFASSYSTVLFIGTIFSMCQFGLGQLVRAEGAAMASMIGMMLGTVTNVVLDPVFIFLFKMGVTGAAVATVAGYIVSVIWYIIFYTKGNSLLKPSIKGISGEKKIWGQTFSIGVPAAANQLLMGVAIIFTNNLAADYGDSVVAALGIVSKIMFIGIFMFIGFSAGCQPLLGYNYGAGNMVRVKAIIKNAMVITSGLGIILVIIFWIFAAPVVHIFTGLPEVVAAGAFILQGYILQLLVVGPQMVASVTVQALGKSLAAAFMAVARQGVFFIPILIFLNRRFGLGGLIYAQAVSDTLTLILGIILLLVVLRPKKRPEAEKLH